MGIVAGRSYETVAGILGVLRAGGVYVPLDPDYPAERLDFMWRDSGATAVLVEERLLREMEGKVAPSSPDQARRLRAVLEANVAALYDYRPRPYPGRLLLYRAEERRNQDSARPELAWIDLAHGGLDFVVVPGNHATMHEPPHVQAMADDLRRRLEGR